MEKDVRIRDIAAEKPEIIFIQPIFKENIWGGDKLRTEYGYPIPSDTTGECWAVSAHENGDCKVANGKYKGRTLTDLWKNQQELFGNLNGDKFPLLVKIIDAKDDLSIQVHPNDSYAKIHENGSLGKTECWYILDCKENQDIVIGHNAATKAELKAMIEKKKWNQLIRTLPIKKGDFLQINPGTVHAIKGGTLILETQQNSDITYRVYDYDRLSNGVPRELHIDKSIDVITVPFQEEKTEVTNDDGTQCKRLISCRYYEVFKFEIMKKEEFIQDKPFLIMSVIEGDGKINAQNIKKGMHFILPNGFNTYSLEGNMTLIASAPKV
ncbi:mannose-6-phosphate isomerase type 1 [Lachnotalea glycerini]|uniref:mannose-6-phosphate isomerase n=1 Tax=Lachnotalea glycerini TaxID=1763509 RepID=A0A255IGK7_9FIRM|nr:mannose-6-phosphate isomerase, class I [Lachnotalea glycerini]PXV96166.1 mannose-6-phosphate isomerase type 1 [Lachnotalea glycerini]RDY27504.1 mannose-6-phosphate isomerase, class I [Lachnotalea glycerini]